jgi:hypothetical protein
MVYDRRKYDHLTLEEKVDEALAILDNLANAFPDGPLKHREAHESWIEAKHAETKFWQELKLDIAKKGIVGMLVIILGLLAVGVSVKAGVWLR